ncbi:MAG: shikimate kinase [Candidatus Hodarchaeaceae archaeon]|nr:shikimate kinase [Candidatus Hodarchaeaceae archaeon]
MRGIASACGSATVVNAIATGKGAAFAVDLRVRAEVELTDRAGEIVGRIADEPSESPRLIEVCARRVLEHLGLDRTYGAKISTTSEVPIAVGLSSSSAAANATILATFAALGEKPQPKVAVNLGIDAALEAGVTITGALDDAAASFFGGGVITDNFKRRVLKRFRVDPKLRVLIHVPPAKLHTARVDVERTKLLSKFVEAAHKQALGGDILGALTLNGLLYSCALGHDQDIALDALKMGALAAGLTGTGPAVVAIARPGDVGRVKRIWQKRPGRIVVTRPSIEGARMEVKS